MMMTMTDENKPTLSLPIFTIEGYTKPDLTLDEVRKRYRLVLPVTQLWQHRVHPNLCMTHEGGDKFGIYTIDPEDKMWTLYKGEWFASLVLCTTECNYIAMAFNSGLHRKKTDTLFKDLAKVEDKPESDQKTDAQRALHSALRLRGYIDPRGSR
jgi:hypothetical protein